VPADFPPCRKLWPRGLSLSRPEISAVALALLLTLSLAALPALAERADRGKPLTIDADRSGTFDLAKRVITYVGNVVVAQGTLSIRADKVEVRELAGGRRVATALGIEGKPAVFRQKRDGVNETIEGSAERIEYDDRSDTVRFVGSAAVRRLRGTTTADEITGALITYDSGAEIFKVEGQPSQSTQPGASGNGRVRAIFTPRDEGPGDGKPAPSAPASPASGGGAPPTPP
jgi:lipopolysaccharide export system protein LptA